MTDFILNYQFYKELERNTHTHIYTHIYMQTNSTPVKKPGWKIHFWHNPLKMAEIKQNWKCREDGEKWDSWGILAQWRSLCWIQGSSTPGEKDSEPNCPNSLSPLCASPAKLQGLSFLSWNFGFWRFLPGSCEVFLKENLHLLQQLFKLQGKLTRKQEMGSKEF